MSIAFRGLGRLNTLPLLLILAALALILTACGRPADGAMKGADVEHAIEVLDAAPTHGFPQGAFNTKRIAELSQSEDGKAVAERDRLLRAALVSYAEAQHGLGLPKASLPKDWGMRPKAYDAEAELDAAIKAGKVREWLDGLAPTAPAYRALQEAYGRYLKVVAAGGWPEVPEGAFTPGATGPAVDALHRRLAVEDAALGETPAGVAFDPALAEAVRRFQAAHGLPTTGQVDAATRTEMNVSAMGRAAQIRANLERLRWLPRDEPATRIDVNSAAGLVDYVVDGKISTRLRAAAGKPGDETPILASTIDSIVINPPWNVPEGIAKEELYPKEAANPGYFAANDFEEIDGRLVQKAGPKSALGLVKFDFDNPYAVYLHDTPSKAAFSQTRRAVSHGCVRVEHAVGFAQMLVTQQPGWSASRFDEVLASGETTAVKLSKPTPVRLMYLTAFPENGRIAFRPDVYRWDAELLRLMDGHFGKV
jgi:murein L,D-transpeptidase YcbB/YkuD